MGSRYLTKARSEIEKVLDEPRLTEALTHAFDQLDDRLARLETKPKQHGLLGSLRPPGVRLRCSSEAVVFELAPSRRRSQSHQGGVPSAAARRNARHLTREARTSIVERASRIDHNVGG